ncbi:MAG: Tm-1-like ATP-binding domain-containing protein [bacterium]|nr:Tm-1-like ATP-binding domain-containing protein [bacterium]
MSVYLLATLDTKGAEAQFLAEQLGSLNVNVVLVDVGSFKKPTVDCAVDRDAIFTAAGADWRELSQQGDRVAAVTKAAEGAALYIHEQFEQGNVSGVIGLGGYLGAKIAASAMRTLPIGLPKLLVTTLSSDQIRPFIGDKDVMIVNPVVDFSGLNSINRVVLKNAAAAIAGMAAHRQKQTSTARKRIAATMFGATAPCVNAARSVLESAGYEVVIFEAIGRGGHTMESLIQDGQLSGVLDITTTELADELTGGYGSAGADRLTAAAASGLPQVVSVGALDIAKFRSRRSTPQQFSKRTFLQKEGELTFMRTSAEESEQLGRELGAKVSKSVGPVAVMLPAEGVSALDANDGPFFDPQARDALYLGIRNTAVGVELVEYAGHINDAEFAKRAAEKLIQLIEQNQAEA